MSDYLISLIRTGVPVVVGAVVAWLAARGLNVPADAQVQVTAGLTTVLTFAYYAAVRAAEKRWPAAGVLLGHTAQPVYIRPGRPEPPAS